MSWGLDDPAWAYQTESTIGKNPLVSLFAATGDSGAQVQWPAVSNFVVGVGGTSVYLNSDGSFAYENGWTGSGGGCSPKNNGTAAQWGWSGYLTEILITI